MQYKFSQYNPNLHDRFTALTVQQPYASKLLEMAYELDGIKYAEKTIEVRSKKTNFRGDIIITSSATPIIEGLMSGVILGFVELYDCKPMAAFNLEDWEQTAIPKKERKNYSDCYGWLMRNPRKVVEFPVSGQVGLWNLVYTKGEIIEYPRVIGFEKKCINLIKEQINEKIIL